jgi:hypothetical protein
MARRAFIVFILGMFVFWTKTQYRQKPDNWQAFCANNVTHLVAELNVQIVELFELAAGLGDDIAFTKVN